MAHERFDYDGDTMRLSALICLCDDCNDVTHPGHATTTGKKTMSQILAWYAEVADISAAEARVRMRQATDDFNRRSYQEGKLARPVQTPCGDQSVQHTAKRGKMATKKRPTTTRKKTPAKKRRTTVKKTSPSPRRARKLSTDLKDVHPTSMKV